MNILITDDDPTTRVFLKALLSKLGHQAAECASGEELLELRQAGKLPPLVFLDWELPGLQGPDVCRKLREDPSAPPPYVILATGRGARDDVMEGLRAGASDYIVKPFNEGEVRSRVEIALRSIELNELVARQKAQLISKSRLAMLGEMADGMAHEINNPLSIIQMRAEKTHQDLLSGKFDPVALAANIEPMFRLINRISSIIQSLRAFASEGSEDEPFREVPVKALLDQASSFVWKRLDKASVTIELIVPDESLRLECRPQQLTETLLGLLTNSLQAVKTAPEKAIRVEVRKVGEQIEIAVTDTGTGIAPEIREKIMQPFFTTHPVGQGTGLGLSVALGVAQSHGGDLKLDTSSQRTRFVLTVPCRQPRVRKAA